MTVFFSACNAMPVNELMYRIVTSVIAFGYVDYSVRQTGLCFIEVFANTPYLQGVHHTHISGDHNDP